MIFGRNPRRAKRRPSRNPCAVEPLEGRELLTVQFQSGVEYVGDRARAATFQLIRTRDPASPPAPEVVRVDTVDGAGTAIPGVDYTPVHKTLTFRPGESSRTLRIPISRGGGPDRSVVLSLDGAPYPSQFPDPRTALTTSDEGWYFSGPRTPQGLRSNRPTDQPGTLDQRETRSALAIVVHQPDRPPPFIRESHLQVVRGQVTGFVVTFSHAMAVGPASDPRHYDVLGKGPATGSGPIPLVAAIYDPTRHQVTLVPSHPVRLGGYVLRSPTPTSRSPIVDDAGVLLDGNSDRLPDGLLYANFNPLGRVAGFSRARQVRQNTISLSNKQHHGIFHKVIEPINQVLDPFGIVLGIAKATAPDTVARLKLKR